MDAVIIFCAQYLLGVLLLAVVALSYSLAREQRVRLLLAALGALAIAYALARVVGVFFQHEQPFAAEGYTPLIPHAVDNSFPSDHSALGAALAGVAWFFNRRLGYALAVAAVLVGAARVAAGLHYPVDVVVGLLLGVSAAYLAHWLAMRFSGR